MGLIMLAAGWVSAEDYPNKPIRLVTSTPGGAGDLMARLVAQEVSNSLGQPVIVDNRPTVTSRIIVAKAPPDGYTILFTSRSLWIAPLLESMPYDPVKDFSPITVTAESPNVLVVHPSSQLYLLERRE